MTCCREMVPAGKRRVASRIDNCTFCTTGSKTANSTHHRVVGEPASCREEPWSSFFSSRMRERCDTCDLAWSCGRSRARMRNPCYRAKCGIQTTWRRLPSASCANLVAYIRGQCRPGGTRSTGSRIAPLPATAASLDPKPLCLHDGSVE